jgi:hypothetical protein
VEAVSGLVAGAIHVANQLNDACSVIVEFKKHIENIIGSAKQGQETLTE